MKLLIVSATDGEVAIAKKYIAEGGKTGHEVHMLTTGVGPIATAFALTRELSPNSYDLVLQAGVGGSFDKSIPLGSLVKISAERYGDLGAEDHDQYLDIFSMGLMPADEHPHSNGWLVTPASPWADKMELPSATGLTVSTVSGSERTITMRMRQYGCQVESMEGAALHYTCLQLGQPFAQVRAISNYVIPRDKSQWQMKDAIINLNNWLIDFLSKG